MAPAPGVYYFFTANPEMITKIQDSEFANVLDAVYTSEYSEEHLLFYKVQIKRNSDQSPITII